MALLVERLHAFFSQTAGLPLDHRPPVRVIIFLSTEEYKPYRLRPSTDAYYVGNEHRDYIVMPALGGGGLQVAAHEYWHLVMHASDLRLPLWLEEGMADFFSTARLGETDKDGDARLTSRFQTLHGHAWMPLDELLALQKESPVRDDREAASLFYTESWALTEMLLAAPAYGPRLPEFLTAVVSGMPAGSALAAVYAKPLDAVSTDLRAWIERHKVMPVSLPDSMPDTSVEVSEASPLASGMLLADLLATTGKMDRAEALYEELANDAPDDPYVMAALATIAHKKEDDATARRLWRRAFDQGVEDDDALYNLALLDNNAGEYEAALTSLGAMRHIAPARQFAYWSATAYAANQLGRREEAESAADNARAHASTETERAYADELRTIAQTDVEVQFTRDANGQVRLVNVRAPHGAPEWNPFIEPGDQVRRVEGKLRDIDCGAETVFRVETAAGPLRLTLPDPKHVQMHNAPSEYTCGPQPASDVSVVYAASGPGGGVLRGMEFR